MAAPTDIIDLVKKILEMPNELAQRFANLLVDLIKAYAALTRQNLATARHQLTQEGLIATPGAPKRRVPFIDPTIKPSKDEKLVESDIEEIPRFKMRGPN